MNRHPVILTTLEEDLKRLGLLVEEGPETRGPEVGVSSSNTSPGTVGAKTDKPSDKGETGTDEMPGESHKGKVSKTIPAAKEPEMMKGGGKQEGIKGMPDKKRAVESEESDDDGEDTDAKSDDDKDDEKDESMNASSMAIESIARAKSKMENKSFDHVSKLLADANSIMESIDESRRSESVKAFANVSIMAEMLRRGIGSYAERVESAELSETAESFGLLSTEAQSFAEQIEEGVDLDDSNVAEQFQNQIGALLSGLDFYSEIMEELQIEEGDDDGDDDEDDGDDDADSDDDDDDSKKKADEAVRLEPGLGTSRKNAATVAKSVRSAGMKLKPGSSATMGHVKKQSVHRVERTEGKAESRLSYGSKTKR